MAEDTKISANFFYCLQYHEISDNWPIYELLDQAQKAEWDKI